MSANDINPADYIVSTYRQGRQGGWITQPDTGVTVVHKPSGLSESCSDDRSVHRNRVTAFSRLNEKVAAWKAGGGQPDGSIGTPLNKSIAFDKIAEAYDKYFALSGADCRGSGDRLLMEVIAIIRATKKTGGK